MVSHDLKPSLECGGKERQRRRHRAQFSVNWTNPKAERRRALLRQLGNHGDAVVASKRATELKPEDADGFNSGGNSGG